MKTKPVIPETEQVRVDILDAAEQRLRTYGYGKTTMAEIAHDVNMSAANLYRYFDNKLDIGAALAQRCFADRYTILKEVVDQANLSATEKLQAFVLTTLNYTHTQFSEAPKVNELVDIIVTERCDLIQQKIDNDLKLIKQILEYGVQQGDFAIDDMTTTAQAVQHATVKFSVPLFMSMYPLDEFERHARALVDLLIQGLSKKK